MISKTVNSSAIALHRGKSLGWISEMVSLGAKLEPRHEKERRMTMVMHI